MKLPFNTAALGKSMIELFLELDAIPWYYKAMTATANWTMLAGFIVLPGVFVQEKANSRIDVTAARILAWGLLALSYLATGFLCWRFSNLLFRSQSIFMPGFSNSTIGLLNSLFNIYGKKYNRKGEEWSASAICTVTLCLVLMILYGAAILNTNQQLAATRDLAKRAGQRTLGHEDETLLPAEERTRRNLLGLLLAPQQQLSTQQSQYQRGFSTTVQTPAHRPPTTAAASSQASFVSTPYPPATPMSTVASPDSSIYMGDYGRISPHPGVPVSDINADRNASGNVNINKENMWSRSGYSALRGGYTRNDHGVGPQSQHPSIGRRNSIFAGISATVGRGRERIGAGWNTWSAS